MSVEAAPQKFHKNGFCVLETHYPASLLRASRNVLAGAAPASEYLSRWAASGPQSASPAHALFEPPCFALEFFFDANVLAIGGPWTKESWRDQWGCDPLLKETTTSGGIHDSLCVSLVRLRHLRSQAVLQHVWRSLTQEQRDLLSFPVLILHLVRTASSLTCSI